MIKEDLQYAIVDFFGPEVQTLTGVGFFHGPNALT